MVKRDSVISHRWQSNFSALRVKSIVVLCYESMSQKKYLIEPNGPLSSRLLESEGTHLGEIIKQISEEGIFKAGNAVITIEFSELGRFLYKRCFGISINC